MPQATCLVTTRIALHVSGEQEYPIAGLPAPPDMRSLSEVDRLNLPRTLREFDLATLNQFEAVRLFIARAAAVKPGFAVTEANAPAVAGIAGRLHGMPLAIELAAARVKVLTPDQILARLEHHLALLTAGSRDVPERQQTLRGAIAWSYDLLDAGGRCLLDRLSVFRGGFTLDRAETVGGPAGEIGGDILDRLGDLVDQSLIRPDDDADGPGQPRFTMLETIREYGAEQLAGTGQDHDIRRRHATAFLGLAQAAAAQLTGSEQRTWLDRLERDHDNLRAALDWAVEREPTVAAQLAFGLWRFWQQRGYLNEARARFASMAGMDWVLDPVDRARFAEAFGGVAYWQTDRLTTVTWYDEALAIWRERGDQAEIANALFNRAYADMVEVMGGRASRDTLGPGRTMLLEALDIYRSLSDQGGEGNIVWGLGSFHYFTADAATAEVWFRRSLELHRAAGDRSMEAWSLHMIALAEIAQGRFADAKTVANHALQHFYEAGDISGVTLVLDELAQIAVAEGDTTRGGRLWGAARHLQATTGTTLADYVEQNYELFGIATPNRVMAPDDLARTAAEGAAMGLDEVVAYALSAEGGARSDAHAETSP